MNFVPLDKQRISEMTALWNKEWVDSFPMRDRLVQQNMFEDRNVLAAGSWMVLEEETDQLLGFIVAKAWQDDESGVSFSSDTGWIHALVVAPEWRGRGIGGLLLEKAEAALRAAGASQFALGNDFHWRMFPGLPEVRPETKAWFEKRGYEVLKPTYDLIHEYGDTPADAVELPQAAGVTFRLAKPDDRAALIAFMERCFPGRWEYQTKQYWERGGSGREFVVLEKDGGELIGFCRLNDSRSPLLAQNIYWAPMFEEELGGIGPLGIDEQYRGYRYGLSIVQAAVSFLRQRGIRRIVIDTTPYVDFYGKLGYRIWKTYWRLHKTGH